MSRGGVEFAYLYEWGGNNADGTYGFDEQRPGWGVPIHQLLITNHVSAVFHGHDHVFVKQDLDGIVYQELPQPSNDQPDNTNLAAEYGYVNGDVVAGSGHLCVTVTPEQVTVDFIHAYLSQNGQVNYTYTLYPRKILQGHGGTVTGQNHQSPAVSLRLFIVSPCRTTLRSRS